MVRSACSLARALTRCVRMCVIHASREVEQHRGRRDVGGVHCQVTRVSCPQVRLHVHSHSASCEHLTCTWLSPRAAILRVQVWPLLVVLRTHPYVATSCASLPLLLFLQTDELTATMLNQSTFHQYFKKALLYLSVFAVLTGKQPSHCLAFVQLEPLRLWKEPPSL